MSELTKAQELEEQKKWDMKYFDYAENPIKEWIADFLDDSLETIFNDYNEESFDVLHIEHEGVYYDVYLTPWHSADVEFDHKLLMSSESLRKAASIMFDSVRKVYIPVVKTMANLAHRMTDITPHFDDKKMCFNLSMINRKQMEQDHYINTIRLINDNLHKIEGKDDVKFNEIRTKLNEQLALANAELFKITPEDIQAKQEECDLFNSHSSDEDISHLFIVIEKSSGLVGDNILSKRLTDVGNKYSDPDENISEKIKDMLLQ